MPLPVYVTRNTSLWCLSMVISGLFQNGKLVSILGSWAWLYLLFFHNVQTEAVGFLISLIVFRGEGESSRVCQACLFHQLYGHSCLFSLTLHLKPSIRLFLLLWSTQDFSSATPYHCLVTQNIASHLQFSYKNTNTCQSGCTLKHSLSLRWLVLQLLSTTTTSQEQKQNGLQSSLIWMKTSTRTESGADESWVRNI